jgi:DNA-directed RNA polymerase specialized sigma subunit
MELSHWLPLVSEVARRIRRQFPCADQDEIESDGNLALMRAAETWDSQRLPFRQYASICIWRAMMERLRREHRYRTRIRYYARITRTG